MPRRLRHQSAYIFLCVFLASSVSVRAQGEDPGAKAASESALGQQTFSACAPCHGLDGRGGEHAPNIATDPEVQRMTDAGLKAIIANGIPGAGMPGFRKQFDDRQIQAVLQYLRVLQGSGPGSKLTGNGKAGRELFFGRGECAACHTVNGQGGFLGADLSGYGRGKSAADILDAIVAPNKHGDSRHGTVTVLSRSGKTYRGVVRNEDNFSLQMQTADGGFHLFDKSDLVHIEHDSRSLMPSDYGSSLNTSELNDLVTFLAQIGSPSGESERVDDQE